MTDTTQPPAETLAEAREAAALAFDARARKASHPEVVTLERHHAKVIRAGEGDDYDAVQAALIALTRRAGGDAIPARVVEADFPREKIARLCLSALYGFEFTGDSLCDEADRIFSRPNVRAAKAVALADAIDALLSNAGGSMTHTTQPPAGTLAACPFCGADAELEHGSDHHGAWFNLGCSRHWGSGLVDADDGCIGGRIFYTETETPEAEAIIAWNTRAALTRRAGGDAIPAGEASEALRSLERFVGDHSGNDDTTDGMEVDRRAQEALSTLRGILAATSLAPAIGYVIPAEEVACRFDGIPYSRADLKIAQRAACAIVPLYGTGDHGEQEAASAGKLWNDHPAVHGALRALHEARVATPKPPAGGDAGANAADILDHYARFIRDEVKADDFERHPYLPHIEQVAADLRAALALPAPVVEGDAETVPGRVGWHTSEEGGGPDVGISVGLGNGSALWIGELLDRDGGPVGIVFHGPGGARHAARLTELDEVRDLFEHHLAPAIAALSEGRSHG